MNHHRQQDPAYRQKTIEFILTGPERYEEARRRMLYDLFGKLDQLESAISTPSYSREEYERDVKYQSAKNKRRNGSRIYYCSTGPLKLPEEERRQKLIVWKPKTREELKEEISRSKSQEEEKKKTAEKKRSTFYSEEEEEEGQVSDSE